MSEEGRLVRLTIPAKPEYITLGRLALTAIAGVRPVSDEALHDLKLALTESCTFLPLTTSNLHVPNFFGKHTRRAKAHVLSLST